ncbi:MAG: YdeI/OmpD-associated family protein [Bacteroidota bacterium]
MTYDEAVDEALCFGWVDSKPNKRDYESYYQFFSPRNPKSNWSRVNKEKVERLLSENRMAPSGLKMVEKAKENGSWDALNDVENLIPPKEMEKLLKQNPKAENHWNAFPKSVKRGILEWIFNAKRQETKMKRIEETVRLAKDNKRANRYRK